MPSLDVWLPMDGAMENSHERQSNSAALTRHGPSHPEIEAWLIARIAEQTGCDPADVDTGKPLADFSLDSSVIVTLTEDLARWLDSPLDVTIMWEHPTIDALSTALANRSD